MAGVLIGSVLGVAFAWVMGTTNPHALLLVAVVGSLLMGFSLLFDPLSPTAHLPQRNERPGPNSLMNANALASKAKQKLVRWRAVEDDGLHLRREGKDASLA
ncbi:uncharacterized protein PG986_006940 [Apiospora aurea]|uniref:Uncharacterized protein n=1 Tax=Apiospora aurea TaxID=335848 RepID=A0ABR1QBG2_9PEZI